MIAAFGQPDLDVPIDAMRAVRGRRTIARGKDGHLLAEQFNPSLRQRKFRRFVVGFVEAKIVIVLRPVRWRSREELNEAWETELFMPAGAQLPERRRRAVQDVVVIDDVPGPDEEVWLEISHCDE